MVINYVQSLLNETTDHSIFNLLQWRIGEVLGCSMPCATSWLILWHDHMLSSYGETEGVVFVCFFVFKRLVFHSQAVVSMHHTLPKSTIMIWKQSQERFSLRRWIPIPGTPQPTHQPWIGMPTPPPSHPFQELKIPSGDLFPAMSSTSQSSLKVQETLPCVKMSSAVI